MAISSLGIGSGIDIGSLVNQLIKAEGEPALNRLQTKEVAYQAEISGFGSLKSALSSFQSSLSGLKDVSDFQGRSATSSDQAIFSATADSTASAGVFGVEVVQLAESQKLISKDTYFSSATDTVGEGTLTFTQNGISFDVSVVVTETLEEVRDAINNAGDNTGITAAIINVDDGLGGTESKLLLTADKTGVDNNITITTDDTGDGESEDLNGLSRLRSANLVEQKGALDGQIKVDGQLISSENNTFIGIVDGVTINAIDVGADETLTIALDKNAVTAKINSFISSYNSLVDTFKTLSSFDSGSNVAGVLLGDSTLRAVESSIRTAVYSVTPGLSTAFSALAEIGVTTDDAGKLTLDSSKLNPILVSSFDDLGGLFAGDGGLATKLENLVKNYVKSDGLIDSRTDGLKLRIDDITSERERLEVRLTSMEAMLLKKFSAMDALVGTLNNQSSFLTQQLDNLPGAYNPNKK